MDLTHKLKLQNTEESDKFLAISDQFKLGRLITEQPHPHTEGLSNFCKNDIPEAIKRLRNLDVNVWDILISSLDNLNSLYLKILETLQSKNRVFICGCGSTGRLALTIETIYRQQVKQLALDSYIESVISFMSGGDVAIINSVEDFEDHPQFGAQQLHDLGFTENDLLIASTEGGETPWVIGATEEASKLSKHKPFFLYCNPDEVLLVERSQRVLNNPNIIKINLTVGNQAITGSTRMQCSTILTQGIGLPLFGALNKVNGAQFNDLNGYSKENLIQIRDFYKNLDFDNFLIPFIESESKVYSDGNYLTYRSNNEYGISILTDTTERSPTFSLYPFESNNDHPTHPSLCYFLLTEKFNNVADAWVNLFNGRKQRSLDGEYWEKYKEKVSLDRVLQFDIGADQIKRRLKYCGDKEQYYIGIIRQGNSLIWEFGRQLEDKQIGAFYRKIDLLNGLDILQNNIILKCMLNTLSVIVMGRMGRFLSNIMVYVRPSNNKLIDRAIRYAQYLLQQNKEKLGNQGVCDYKTICHALHAEKETLVYGEAIVLKTLKKICSEIYGIENIGQQ